MVAKLWRLEQWSRCHPYVNPTLTGVWTSLTTVPTKTTFLSVRVAGGGGGVGGVGGQTTASMYHIRRSLGLRDTSHLSVCTVASICGAL